MRSPTNESDTELPGSSSFRRFHPSARDISAPLFSFWVALNAVDRLISSCAPSIPDRSSWVLAAEQSRERGSKLVLLKVQCQGRFENTLLLILILTTVGGGDLQCLDQRHLNHRVIGRISADGVRALGCQVVVLRPVVNRFQETRAERGRAAGGQFLPQQQPLSKRAFRRTYLEFFSPAQRILLGVFYRLICPLVRDLAMMRCRTPGQQQEQTDERAATGPAQLVRQFIQMEQKAHHANRANCNAF